MTPARRRIPAIEGARAVAAFSVLTFHVLQAHGIGGPVVGRLWLGVPLFFVISGFVLFRPFCSAILGGAEPPVLRTYARARLLRIFPALWVMTAVALLVLYPSARGGVLLAIAAGLVAACALRPPRRATVRLLAGVIALAAGATGAFLAAGAGGYATTTALDQFTLLQLFTLAKPVVLVGPVWTLCIEMSFYALLPALAWVMLRSAEHRSRRATTVVLVELVLLAGFGLLYNQFMGWGSGVPTTVLGFLPQFAAGMALAVAVERRAFRNAGPALLGAAVLVAALALAIQNVGPANNTEASGPLFGTAIGAAFGLFLAAVVLPERPLMLTRALSSRLLVWLGTISYGIYLWHYPVILWLGGHLATLSAVVSLALTAALTVGLAVLSWHAVERPALTWARGARKLSLSRRGAAAPAGPAGRAPRTRSPAATR